MIWSKIKKHAEDLLAPELVGRVRYFITSYGPDRPEHSRGWIAVDGEEIWSCRGSEERQKFYELLKSYPNRNFEELLVSEDPVERGMAYLDRRLGKKRLEKLLIGEEKSGFASKCLQLRTEKNT